MQKYTAAEAAILDMADNGTDTPRIKRAHIMWFLDQHPECSVKRELTLRAKVLLELAHIATMHKPDIRDLLNSGDIIDGRPPRFVLVDGVWRCRS